MLVVQVVVERRANGDSKKKNSHVGMPSMSDVSWLDGVGDDGSGGFGDGCCLDGWDEMGMKSHHHYYI